MKFDKIFVLDTNIILNDAEYLYRLSDNGSNLIVLPETVIDELDLKKTGFDEINFQAREFARILSTATIMEPKVYGGSTIVSLKIGSDTYIDLVSLKTYETSDADRAIRNDMKIIEATKVIESFYNIPIIFLSLDVMCRTRAISWGINVQTINNQADDRDYNFIKELEVSEKDFELLNDRDIVDIDGDYLIENYCYKFIFEDYFKHGYIIDDKIKIIDWSELNRSNIKPLNDGQLYALSGMMDTDIDITVISAGAGSGKTTLALSAGMRLVEKGVYDKIIYIRNSIESTNKGEEIGFLSGNDEKMAIYNYPLYDTLEFFIRKKMKKKELQTITQEKMKEKIEDMMDKYNIEMIWPGAIRGRTLTKSFVILDEIQNFSCSTTQTVMTRVDEDSKIIAIGSQAQIDNPFINKHTNGLNVLMEQCRASHNNVQLFATTLDKVVRGRITEWAENIFSK